MCVGVLTILSKISKFQKYWKIVAAPRCALISKFVDRLSFESGGTSLHFGEELSVSFFQPNYFHNGLCEIIAALHIEPGPPTHKDIYVCLIGLIGLICLWV